MRMTVAAGHLRPGDVIVEPVGQRLPARTVLTWETFPLSSEHVGIPLARCGPLSAGHATTACYGGFSWDETRATYLPRDFVLPPSTLLVVDRP